MIVVILLSILVIAVIVIVVVARKHKEEKKDTRMRPAVSSKTEKDSPKPSGGRYINPTDFSVGVIKDVPCMPSDTCGSKVLYPLSNPDVDYGSKMPKGCPCDQFLESP